MGTVLNIDYSDLNNASKMSRQASTQAENYSKKLDGITKKFSDLKGGQSSNTSNALSFINSKISELNKKATRLDNFADSIDSFKEKVKSTDEAMAKRINTLAGEFKKANNMKISAVSEFFQWLNTDVLNATDFGRWVKDAFNTAADFIGDVKSSIYDWYRTGGGKYIVDSIIQIGVIAVAVVVLCTLGGGLFIAIATAVAAVFSIVNAVSNIVYNARAFASNNSDPAWANRYDKVNKLSDILRFEFNSDIVNGIAATLDVTEIVANTVVIFHDIRGLGSKFKNFAGDKGFVGLKELFGSKNSGGAGIIGSRFMQKTDGVWEMNPKTIWNGTKALFTDSHFRAQIGQSTSRLWGEVKDTVAYTKFNLKSGGEVIKGLFNGDRSRSMSILGNFMKTDMKNLATGGLKHIVNGIKPNFKTVDKFSEAAKLGKPATNIVSVIFKANSFYGVEQKLTGGDLGKILMPDLSKLTGLGEKLLKNTQNIGKTMQSFAK